MQKLAPQHGTSQPERRDGSRSSDRVLEVLKTVASSPAGMTLTSIATTADLAPSTALRQLRSLEASGLIERGTDQLYRAGGELIRVAHQVLGRSTLADMAAPLLARVADESGESAYLALPDRPGFCVYAATAPGPRQLRHSGWLGQQIPTGTTAVGAALGGDVEVDGAVFRADGHEDGVSAASAPVHDATGDIVAAVSAVGPTFRLVGDGLAAARASVVAAAAALTRLLGG